MVATTKFRRWVSVRDLEASLSPQDRNPLLLVGSRRVHRRLYGLQRQPRVRGGLGGGLGVRGLGVKPCFLFPGGDWSGALTYLRRSLSRSAPSDSITRKLFALIARSHQMLGDTGAALRVCAEGLSLDPDDAELWHRKAVVHRNRGESAEAEQCWRRILALRRPDRFCSLDQGIYGHLTWRNLAVLAMERGDHAEAARLWRSVLAECPGDRDALVFLERLQPVVLGSDPVLA